jgi:CheY-like chemotaxis protein
MPKILIVEDDPAVRDILKIALEREGMTVEAVGNGEKALKSFRSAGALDLVILDIMLPDVDGITLCQEFRRDSDVPIVMLTAREGERNVVVGLEVGADDYVTKPASPAEIVSRVRAQLRRRRMDAQEYPVRISRPHDRSLAPPGLGSRGAGRSHRHRVRDSEPSCSSSRMGLQSTANNAAALGRRFLRRGPLGRRTYPAYTQEGRAGPQGSPLHPNRTRYRLQVRGVLRVSNRRNAPEHPQLSWLLHVRCFTARERLPIQSVPSHNCKGTLIQRLQQG